MLLVLDNGRAVDRQITVGAFKDRLGVDALALATSTNEVCRAAKEMLYDRKFVDLDAPMTNMLLDMLIASSQPAANPLFPGSGPITSSKKTQILGAAVNDNERP